MSITFDSCRSSGRCRSRAPGGRYPPAYRPAASIFCKGKGMREPSRRLCRKRRSLRRACTPSLSRRPEFYGNCLIKLRSVLSTKAPFSGHSAQATPSRVYAWLLPLLAEYTNRRAEFSICCAGRRCSARTCAPRVRKRGSA